MQVKFGRPYIWTPEKEWSHQRSSLVKQLCNKIMNKIQAWTRFEPMTSAILVQRPTSYASAPVSQRSWTEILLIKPEFFCILKFHCCWSCLHHCDDNWCLHIFLCIRNKWSFINSLSFFTIHGYIANSPRDQFLVGFIAELVRHRGHGFASICLMLIIFLQEIVPLSNLLLAKSKFFGPRLKWNQNQIIHLLCTTPEVVKILY